MFFLFFRVRILNLLYSVIKYRLRFLSLIIKNDIKLWNIIIFHILAGCIAVNDVTMCGHPICKYLHKRSLEHQRILDKINNQKDNQWFLPSIPVKAILFDACFRDSLCSKSLFMFSDSSCTSHLQWSPIYLNLLLILDKKSKTNIISTKRLRNKNIWFYSLDSSFFELWVLLVVLWERLFCIEFKLCKGLYC